MQPSEALSATAQISVTLAGFAGVVVAFRSGAVHEWSTVDKFRLQILLSNSALPFLLSIFAMLLTTTGLNEIRLWRLCSIVGFVVTAAMGQILSRTYRSLTGEEMKAPEVGDGFLFPVVSSVLPRLFCNSTTSSACKRSGHSSP